MYIENQKQCKKTTLLLLFSAKNVKFIWCLEDKVRWWLFRVYQALSLVGPVCCCLLYSLKLLAFLLCKTQRWKDGKISIMQYKKKKILYLGGFQVLIHFCLSLPLSTAALVFFFSKSFPLPDISQHKLKQFAAKLWMSLLCGNEFNKDLYMCVHYSLIPSIR